MNARSGKLLLGSAAVALAAIGFGFRTTFSHLSGGPSIGRPSVLAVTGAPEVVFDWKRSACDAADIPDLPARAFRDGNGRVQLIASHFETRPMIGPSLDRLRHTCHVVFGSDGNPDPAAFDDREWLASLYALGGSTIVALVHDEYQGNTHPGRCLSGIYAKCWYNAITFAISRDGGIHYVDAPRSRRLVAALPYRYVPDIGPVGLFQPSNIVRNPSDGYYYTLLLLSAGAYRLHGTCVMRTRTLLDPRSWRAWGGSAFDVRFVNPYGPDAASPGSHVCAPVSRPQIGDLDGSLTYNTALRSFLLIGAATGTDPRTGRPAQGFYYSLSSDLVHWTPRVLLMRTPLPWSFACGDGLPGAYPSALDPASRSRNFETTGARFYVYFTRSNPTGCQLGNDRDLVRVPVQVRR